jgi:hypothetical protein
MKGVSFRDVNFYTNLTYPGCGACSVIILFSMAKQEQIPKK